MQRIKKITAILLSVIIMSGVCVFSVPTAKVGASGTGAGLAEWALNAYYSGWSYVYGGATPGAVDCSGLIYSYCGGERTGDAQLYAGTEIGYVGNGIPRVHGLGLYMPGHVGIYIGDGMEVDARNESAGVCYSSMDYMSWTNWFRVSAVSYVYNGWENFNGNYYYYEDGQYVVNTSRNIDGITYNFGSTGISDKTPSDMSSTSSSSSNSSSNETSNNSSSSQSIYMKGSTGSEVTKIQERLAELGFYTGEITGYFGNETEAAYKDFQSAAGLVVDGIAGSDREILYSDSAPYKKNESEKTEENENSDVEEKSEEENQTEEKENIDEEKPTENVSEESETISALTYSIGDENDTVASIQQQLGCLGYFQFSVTGYYGDFTAQAVADFQTANGLEVTGVVDELTYTTIFSANAIPTAKVMNAVIKSSTISVGNLKENADKVSNKNYVQTASDLVLSANESANKALSKSAINLPITLDAEIQRNLNVGIWFALVAIILAVISGIFLFKDRKPMRTTKNKKMYAKANSNVRYW